MLGFLSAHDNPKKIVKVHRISFVSVPDGLSDDEIRIAVSQRALTFARKMNVKNVFLYTGKGTIKYEY